MPAEINTPAEFCARCREHLSWLTTDYAFTEMTERQYHELRLNRDPFSIGFVRHPFFYEFRGTGWGVSATSAIGIQFPDGSLEYFNTQAAVLVAARLEGSSIEGLPLPPSEPGQELWIIFLAEWARFLTPRMLSASDGLFTELRRQRAESWERWLNENHTTHRDLVQQWMDTPVAPRSVTDWRGPKRNGI